MAEASSPYLNMLDCALDSLLHSIASTDNSKCANSVQSKEEKCVQYKVKNKTKNNLTKKRDKQKKKSNPQFLGVDEVYT